MAFTVTRRIREERRKRAEERQAEYDKLTLEQKLSRLPPEPGAKRQRAKLLKKLNELSAKQVKFEEKSEEKSDLPLKKVKKTKK